MIAYNLFDSEADDSIILEAPNVDKGMDKENTSVHVILFGRAIDFARISFEQFECYLNWNPALAKLTSLLSVDIVASTVDLSSPDPSLTNLNWRIIGIHCESLIIPEHNMHTWLYPCFSLHNNLSPTSSGSADGVSACFYNKLIRKESKLGKVFQEMQEGTVLQSLHEFSHPFRLKSQTNKLRFITSKNINIDPDIPQNEDPLHVKMAHQHAMGQFLGYLVSRDKQGISVALNDLSGVKPFALLNISKLSPQASNEISKFNGDDGYDELNISKVLTKNELSKHRELLHKIKPELLDMFGCSTVSQLMTSDESAKLNDNYYFIDKRGKGGGLNNSSFQMKDGEVMLTIGTLQFTFNMFENFNSLYGGKSNLNSSQDLVLNYNDPIPAYRIKQDNLLEFINLNPIINDYYYYLYSYWVQISNLKGKHLDDHPMEKIDEAKDTKITPQIAYRTDCLDKFKSPIMPMYNFVKVTVFAGAYIQSIRDQLIIVALNPSNEKSQKQISDLISICKSMLDSLGELKTVIAKITEINVENRTRFEFEISSDDFIYNVDVLFCIFNELMSYTKQLKYLYFDNSIRLPRLNAKKYEDFLKNAGITFLQNKKIQSAIKASTDTIILEISVLQGNFNEYINALDSYATSMESILNVELVNNEHRLKVLKNQATVLHKKISDLREKTQVDKDSFEKKYNKEVEEETKRNKNNFLKNIFHFVLNTSKVILDIKERNVFDGLEHMEKALSAFSSASHYSEDITKFPNSDALQKYLDYDFHDDFLELRKVEVEIHFKTAKAELFTNVNLSFAENERLLVEADLEIMSSLAQDAITMRDEHITLKAENFSFSMHRTSIDKLSKKLKSIGSKTGEEKAKPFYLVEHLKHVDYYDKLHQLAVLNRYRVAKAYEINKEIDEFKLTGTDFDENQLLMWLFMVNACTQTKVMNKNKKHNLIHHVKIESLVDGYTSFKFPVLENDKFIRVSQFSVNVYIPEEGKVKANKTYKLNWSYGETMLDNAFDGKNIINKEYSIIPHNQFVNVNLLRVDLSSSVEGFMPEDLYRPTPYTNWIFRLNAEKDLFDKNEEVILEMQIVYDCIT